MKKKYNIYEKTIKRLMDFVISFAGLLLLSPILILLVVIGSIVMKGNPFFMQLRPGKDEKLFRLIKFRTMLNTRDKEGKLLPDNERLNAYGKFLRSTSLDELPELWNILVGDLSIIGPRPQLVRDMVFMTSEQRQRHSVRQGLTGLAQISGRNNIPWEEKLDWDLKYIKHITFTGDMKIIFKTIGKVLKRSDVVREGTVSDQDYGDYLLSAGKVTCEEYDNKQLEAKKIFESWKYYNHAMIPNVRPHEKPNLNVISNGSIWNLAEGCKPLMARWTSDFDCGYETNWWYCIKDDVLDINALNAKRRYEINKGKKFFEVKIIVPKEYEKELYRVQVAAVSAYPIKYRPMVEEKAFKCEVERWDGNSVVFAAFWKATNEMCGYTKIEEYSDYAALSVQKSHPDYEKYCVNAALIAEVCKHYEQLLSNSGFYICDGERNISHETKFQDYLVKYFGFRKAYCKLNLKYRKPLGLVIAILFPFRNIIRKFDTNIFIHNIVAVLYMEELRRKSCKEE